MRLSGFLTRSVLTGASQSDVYFGLDTLILVGISKNI